MLREADGILLFRFLYMFVNGFSLIISFVVLIYSTHVGRYVANVSSKLYPYIVVQLLSSE